MIRWLLPFALIAIVSGCSQLARVTPTGSTEVIIPASGRGSSMAVSVPSLNARAVFTPSARNGDVVTWRAPDNTTVSFNQGVLVSTRGLGDDLMGADIGQSLDAIQGGADDFAPKIYSYMNGEFQSYFVSFQCRRTSSSAETVQVGGSSVRATRIDETCLNNERQIENTYWRDRAGTMVKSRQWISAGLGYLETERLDR